MGNVTLLVNQKIWAHGIHRTRVGCFPVSHTASASLTAQVFRLPHFIPVESQRKFRVNSLATRRKSSFGLRNFGSRDAAYVYLSDTHHTQIIDWK